jgi:CRISPR-associated protein Csc1
MRLYHCEVELHDNLFFATREMGRLYECESYLHNYALTYALGLVHAPFHAAQQVPRYREELTVLNDRGIYVTPAAPVAVGYQVVTFKYADNAYHVEMLQARANTPSFGRAKELAVGSRFTFGVISATESLILPRWIRLGLWQSKAYLTITEYPLTRATFTKETLTFPLNPLDIAERRHIGLYDLVAMRPTSLLDHVIYSGAGWQSTDNKALCLPDGLAYRF